MTATAPAPSLDAIADEAAAFLTAVFPRWVAPVALVEWGSGFGIGGLLDEELGTVALSRLPGMPAGASPAGQAMRLVLGLCGANQVLVCQGRRHLYEGYGVAPCVLPVCAAAKAGIRTIILLSAAGGVNPEYRPGTVVAVEDYINNLGTSPLVGPQALGRTYFPAMNAAFSQTLISEFVNATAAVDIEIRLGVYQANLGPQYETPAEVALAARNGADLLGMSLVPQTIAARALECETLGIALVTNPAATNRGRPPCHPEVLDVAAAASPAIMRALKSLLGSPDRQPGTRGMA